MTSEDKNLNSLDILVFFVRHYKIISVLTLLGTLISVIVALTITPEYKSSAIIFPASNTSVSKELLTDISRSPKNIMSFGEDEEAEQLLQILQSNKIRAYLVNKYKLLKHYDLEKSSYPQTALSKLLSKNIQFSRTQYQSIEISVFDVDKEQATSMTKDILRLLDTVYNQIQKKRALGALQIVTKEYNKAIKIKKELQNSLSKIRRIGIYDYEAQSKAYSAAMANSIEKGNRTAQQKIGKDIQLLQQYGGTFIDFSTRLKSLNHRISLLSSKLIEAQVDYEQNLSHKFVVNPPFVPEKKAKPVRWLIVLLSTLGSFCLAVFLLLFWEQWKKIDWKEKRG